MSKDVVLKAKAKMPDNMVNGLQDAIVRDMIKQLLLENTYTLLRGAIRNASWAKTRRRTTNGD